MSEVIITLDRLGKCYRIRHQSETPRYTALRDVITDSVRALVKRPSGGSRQRRERSVVSREVVSEDFWALRDVSFEVKRGEVVGVIGRNGAGKSTLLKVLSQITEPSEGSALIEGRVASLLEVGTGFHPELTGRENVFLNGAILGMSRLEIRKKFDEIVEFAEVERFLDTPVKFYSSGMYVRLAFAVAAHLEPEILIVDEVLAVGDSEFQRRCLGKMQDVSRGGRTVLFVSHNMEAMSLLTDRAVLLSEGRVAGIGPTREMISRYLTQSSHSGSLYESNERSDLPKVTRVELKTSQPGGVQQHGSGMEVIVRLAVPMGIRGCRLEICACDDRLQRVFHVWRHDGDQTPLCRAPGCYRIICRIPKVRLYAGRYTILMHLAERTGGRLFEKLEGLCPFDVVMIGTRDGGWQPNEGVYIEDAAWSVESELGSRDSR